MDRKDDTRRAGPSGRSYWIFQLTFWCLLLLPDFLTIGHRPSLLDFLWSVANIALLVVATHVFHLLTKKRGWLYLPPGRMITRTAVAVVIMAAIYFAGAFPEKLFSGPERNRLFRDPAIITGYALGALVLSCAWAGC